MKVVRWCLSFHAAYRCRHSGACCSAGWAIPFDRHEAARVDALPLRSAGRLLRPRDEGGIAFASVTDEGRCSFFDPESRFCEIHRLGGHAALPVTCRMFPRVVLVDPRGTFVTLSHYCPTAAGMLFDDAPVSIVEAPVSLVQSEPLDGLDATKAWSPLVRAGVLMDVECYGEWERRAIALLTSESMAPWLALDRLECATAGLLEWTPGSAPLSHAIDEGFARGAQLSSSTPPDGSLTTLVRDAIPRPLVPPESHADDSTHLPAALDAMEREAAALNRWLAARLFGTWMAYQGSGLQTILRYMRAALDVLTLELARGASQDRLDRRAVLEAVRRSDYVLVHLADSQRLAKSLIPHRRS